MARPSKSQSMLPTETDPQKFYGMVKILQSVGVEEKKTLEVFDDRLWDSIYKIDNDIAMVSKAAFSVLKEEQRMTRYKALDGEQEQDPLELLRSRSNTGFLEMVFYIIQGIQNAYHIIAGLTEKLRPGTLILREQAFTKTVKDLDNLQHMLLEFQLNAPVLNRFAGAVSQLMDLPESIVDLSKSIRKTMEGYYERLLHRHSVEGIEVHGASPVATDLAMSIYDNVDASGEIEDGRNPNELSAYTIRKAEILAETLKEGLIANFIASPRGFGEFVKDNLTNLYGVSIELKALFAKQCEDTQSLLDPYRHNKTVRDPLDQQLQVLDQIGDLNPEEIVFREKTTFLTPEERFNLKFRNETLRKVVALLMDPTVHKQGVIQYILERKAELRRYFQDENSFYVCKIGNGNPFSGEAPGALTVIPGSRPKASLDEILGSGFAEVKRFFETSGSAAKFQDLFIATSPSRSADKQNVLLVGPPGCGKSEVLRAVGSDKDSIGVFAQGSDFLTCWKGEAEKNPKRLFEAGLKLAKDSKKHVHFLLDEVDSVLNGDREHGTTNLTLEFQILMDGVVEYPNLSVWGATNNPERIPMPMIRRFAKVLIVGELSQEDRIRLLRQFVSFLPTKGMDDSAWDDAATRLEGATGDVIRKIADALWRDKMTQFTQDHAGEAEKLVKWLNEQVKFDVRNFTGEQRGQLHHQISPFVSIIPQDLDDAIDLALDNIAVHNEIETAKDSYSRAKSFLAALSQKTKRGKAKQSCDVEQPAEQAAE